MVSVLCAAGIAPAECTQDNAIDVIAMSQAPNELFCMQDSTVALASLAIQAGPTGKCASGLIDLVQFLVGERDDMQDQVSALLSLTELNSAVRV